MTEHLANAIAVVRGMVRALARRRLYSSLAIALLALGLACAAAIFAVVNATLLRPLPYPNPARLFALTAPEPTGGDSLNDLVLSNLLLARWRAETRAFNGIEGYTPATLNLDVNGEPVAVAGAFVSAGLFDVLGVKPAMGRSFTRNEEVEGSGVAMISYGLWRSRFAGDPHVIGRAIRLNDRQASIVGVMPATFTMLFQDADAWLPIDMGPTALASRSRLIAGLGRLKADVSPQQGSAGLASITKTIATEHPDQYRFTRPRLVPMHDAVFGVRRTSLIVLMIAVVILLLIAVVNVASLALADVVARRTDTMTRLALGAKRTTIVVTRLAETLCLALFAAALALAGAHAVLGALRTTAPDAFAGFGVVRIDGASAAFVVMLAVACAFAIAIPAALAEGGVSLDGLAGALTRSVGNRVDSRRREMLLVLQVAVAVVLLLGAALLARNFTRLTARPTGFDARDVTVIPLAISREKYQTIPARAQYVEQLRAAMQTLPGAQYVSTTQTRFVLGESMETVLEVEGLPAPDGQQRVAAMRHVTPDFTKVLRARLLEGRPIDAADRIETRRVAVVSQSFARLYWPGQSAIGKRVRRVGAADSPWLEIVGVIQDMNDAGIGFDVGPALYVSYMQRNTPTARVTIVVRSVPGATLTANTLRRAIWSVDPAQLVEQVTPLNKLVATSVAQPRFQTIVTLLFAGGALLLVLGGLYAVTLYGVLRSTRELGVRAALGARPLDLVRVTMLRSLRPASVGIVAGSALAVPLIQWMQRALQEHLLWSDVPLLVAVAVLLFAAAGTAAWLPARRALRIPPSIAMRA